MVINLLDLSQFRKRNLFYKLKFKQYFDYLMLYVIVFEPLNKIILCQCQLNLNVSYYKKLRF